VAHTEGDRDKNLDMPHTPTILNEHVTPDHFGTEWGERQMTALSKVLEKKKKHLTSSSPVDHSLQG